MEVYLIRHTTPQIEKGICYGQSDILLAETFPNDRQKLLQQLPDRVDAVYSSPLSRCIKLAELVKSNQKIIEDKRLMEMNFGNWEMKKWDEINQVKLNKWMTDFVNEKTPKGESFADLNQRVKEFFEELIISQSNKNKKIIIITHAGVVRSVLCQLLEIPLSNAFKVKIDYGSITNIFIDKNSYNQSIKFINRTL